MAIDKAVDSSKLNDDLKAIADAIRTKGGTSGMLEFPGGFADAIAAIQAGGGGTSGGLAYDMGEFATDSDTTKIKSVPHNLGEKPDVCVVWTDYFKGKLSKDKPGTGFSTNEITTIGFIFLEGLTGIENQRLSSSAYLTPPIKINLYIWDNDYRVLPENPSSYVYGAYSLTESDILNLFIRNNAYWRAGITYKYFVCKKWW